MEFDASYSLTTDQVQTEPIATQIDASPQKRKGSVFVDRSHDKDAFAALTKNETGELVIHILDLWVFKSES
jgi:hypothetical protein